MNTPHERDQYNPRVRLKNLASYAGLNLADNTHAYTHAEVMGRMYGGSREFRALLHAAEGGNIIPNTHQTIIDEHGQQTAVMNLFHSKKQPVEGRVIDPREVDMILYPGYEAEVWKLSQTAKANAEPELPAHLHPELVAQEVGHEVPLSKNQYLRLKKYHRERQRKLRQAELTRLAGNIARRLPTIP